MSSLDTVASPVEGPTASTHVTPPAVAAPDGAPAPVGTSSAGFLLLLMLVVFILLLRLF